MSRALPDEVKIKRGTFDPRYSASARAERNGAVILFPTLNEIPACSFPLDKEGQEFYDAMTRTLREQGRLTILNQREIEMLAFGMSDARRRAKEGVKVSATALTQMLSRIDKLQREDVDRAYNTGPAERKSKFARNGFAARRQ